MKKRIYGDKLNNTMLYLFHYLSLFEIISTASEKKNEEIFIVSDSSRDLVSDLDLFLQFQVKKIFIKQRKQYAYKQPQRDSKRTRTGL